MDSAESIGISIEGEDLLAGEFSAFESPRNTKNDVSAATGLLKQIYFPYSELTFVKDIKLHRNHTKLVD
jgi:hypothetical protein